MIQLEFSRFELEDIYACHYAYVSVYDSGGAEEEHFIHKFCGLDSPHRTYTSAHRMYIEFVSLEIGTGRGFTASVEFMELESEYSTEFMVH